MDSSKATEQSVQQALADELHTYWQQAYRAYQAQAEAPPPLWPPQAQAQTTATLKPLPAAVQAAYQFYQEQLVQPDRGNVSLTQRPMADALVYVIAGRTDGDDGWLEVYGEDGTSLGFGRTYIELIAWVDQTTLRQQVETGEFPDTLDRSQTLWGANSA